MILAAASLETLRSDGPGPCVNMVSQADPLEGPATPVLGISEVMAAITACQTALTSKLVAVQLDVGLLRQVLDKIRSTLTTVEVRVSNVEDTTAVAIRTLQAKAKILEYRVEGAKYRCRSNNI